MNVGNCIVSMPITVIIEWDLSPFHRPQVISGSVGPLSWNCYRTNPAENIYFESWGYDDNGTLNSALITSTSDDLNKALEDSQNKREILQALNDSITDLMNSGGN